MVGIAGRLLGGFRLFSACVSVCAWFFVFLVPVSWICLAWRLRRLQLFFRRQFDDLRSSFLCLYFSA